MHIHLSVYLYTRYIFTYAKLFVDDTLLFSVAHNEDASHIY